MEDNSKKAEKSLNKVTLIGRFGHDPEVTGDKLKICKFNLATSSMKKDKSVKTQWHPCTSFNKDAEIIAEHMKKGSRMYVEGRLEYGSYEKDGITRYTVEIIVSDFLFL